MLFTICVTCEHDLSPTIKIDNSNLKLDILYTGTFPNDNLDVALRSVFSTLGMNYRLSDNKKDVMIEK